jgi:hypothetical protein
LIFGLIGITIAGYAQIIVQGKVFNNNTGLPVPGASVYLNNTTYGTFTNDEGRFTLGISNIFAGDLIVIAAGYEQLAYKLSLNNAEKKLFVFKLEVKEKRPGGFVPMMDAGRQHLLNIFKANFLGVTEEAESCSIMNPDAVYFIINKNIVYAYADTTLIINNKLLGYTIAFDLVEFYFDFNKFSPYCLGYSRYEEMEGSKKYVKRRKQNYYGSTMHFFRSLTNRELETEGFSIFEVKKSLEENDSVYTTSENSVTGKEPQPVIPLRPVNILFIDSVSNEYYLQFTNTLMVQFIKDPRRKHHYITEDINARNSSDFGFTAYIHLLEVKAELDARGFIRNPEAIQYSGFWEYEKLANRLPFNYMPD